jgi:hypothetical protein
MDSSLFAAKILLQDFSLSVSLFFSYLLFPKYIYLGNIYIMYILEYTLWKLVSS